MRLFILGVLAALSSVHGASVGYPYRNELLSFRPARGEFPVQHGTAQGYVRYIDGNGAERLVPYQYQQPLFAIRRLSNGQEDSQNLLLRGGFVDNTQQNQQQFESNFRAWCEQRYNALRAEIDQLRAQGMTPSQSMIEELKPLETALASTDATIETPEMKLAREEQLRLWNEARLQVEAEEQRLRAKQAELQQAQLPSFQLKKNVDPVEQLVEETAEQKRAREQHLRIYQEQLQQIDAQRLLSQPAENIQTQQLQSDGVQTLDATNTKTFVENTEQTKQVAETPEVVRATEEHLRLWNEAKLRAEQSNEQPQAQNTLQGNTRIVKNQEIQEQNVQLQPEVQQPEIGLRSDFILPQTIQDTPEVIRAREEHLRAVNEAKLRTQAAESYIEEKPQKEFQQSSGGLLKATQNSEASILPIEPLEDTPEVKRAREEHLRIFNEAKRLAEKQQQIESSKLQESSGQSLKANSQTENSPQLVLMTDQERILETERLRENERLMAEERLREERLLEAERQREAERIALEAKLREDELQREMLRLKEEERMEEAERMRIEREEAARLAMERSEEAKLLDTVIRQGIKENNAQRTESEIQNTQGQIKKLIPSTIPIAAVVPAVQQPLAAGYFLKNQYQNNPFLLRISNQPNSAIPFATSVISPSQQQPTNFYLRSVENPFLTFTGGKQDTVLKTTTTNSAISSSLSSKTQSTLKEGSEIQTQLKADLKPTGISSDGGSASSALSASSKFNYGSSSDVAALEKARREHFRAHEEALEQLRLANLRNTSNKDCN